MSRYETMVEDDDDTGDFVQFSSVDINSRHTSSAAHHASSPHQPVTQTTGFLQYLTLTLALGGLQFVWSVETGYGTLYLLSLGLKKSLMSLVWLAGPLSGLITQPLVGALSDKCTSRFGRRRPYIVGATIAVILCLTVIGWTKELVGGRQTAAIWAAVVAFYVLDFAINCIQASLRALIVDVLPPRRQDAGTAWASRMIGVGNVAGYLLGFVDLAKYLRFLGNTQLQVLTTVASVTLVTTVAVTCWFTRESPLQSPPTSGNGGGLGVVEMFRQIVAAFRALPPTVRRVCTVQLFSWIGWFPFLFYNTTYVSDLYVSEHSSDKTRDEDGARAGSFAMFTYAVSSLLFSLILPMFAYSNTTSKYLAGISDRSANVSQVTAMLDKVREKMSVSLPVMWMCSLLVFGVCMLSTVLVSTVRGATILIAVCGFSWAVTIWVPFSIIGETISSETASTPGPYREMRRSGGYVSVGDGIPMQDMGQTEAVQESSGGGGGQVSAGTVLGIHNMYIVLPQFITAFASSLIFAMFEKFGAGDSQHANEIAWVLRLGGISSLAAIYFAYQLVY